MNTLLFEFDETAKRRIQKGMLLPTTAMSRMLNGKDMIEELEKMDLKSRIYLFMDSREKVTISDIVEKFKSTPEKIIRILEEMESEGKIRQI